MSIAEGREEQPHWVVRREEVELTEEVLGTGGWGEVKVAKFRGLRVAAKFLHKIIISNYNRRQFSREMTIAAKIRHPNLLLFIGATREGEAVILTELMPTSLRRELETRVMPTPCTDLLVRGLVILWVTLKTQIACVIKIIMIIGADA